MDWEEKLDYCLMASELALGWSASVGYRCARRRAIALEIGRWRINIAWCMLWAWPLRVGMLLLPSMCVLLSLFEGGPLG